MYYTRTIQQWGTRWRSLFRHCATSRKVADSIPDGVNGIFHWHNPSGRTMTLGLTQPLTENSIRIISWGKGGRCVGLKTLSSSCADCLEIWEPLNILESSEPVQACNGIALPLALQSNTTLHITVPCWLMLRHVSALNADHLQRAFFPWR